MRAARFSGVTPGVAVAMVLASVGCDAADTGGTGGGGAGPVQGSQAVTIHFAARIGDVPARCGESLGAVGAEGGDAQLRDLRFFVHDVRLVTPEGVETPVELDQDATWQVANVALLDFENGTGRCEHGTAATHEEVTGHVPSGTYSGLRFKVGVPFELNHGDPTTATPPLDVQSMYWGWGEGFMFFQAVTMTMPPAGEKANAYAVAIASMGCEGDPRHGEVVACNLPNRPEIDLAAFDRATQAVVLDLPTLLEGTKLLSEHGCSSGPKNESCVPLFNRFGLDYTTGAVTPATQTVFRVAPQ